jgi:hypothetical protein
VSASSKRVWIVVGSLVVCGVGFGIGAWLQNDVFRMCGTDLRLARRYSLVDFGDAYGEIEGKVFNVLPAQDSVRPATYEDVVRLPESFTLVRGSSSPGDLGVVSNASKSCSIGFNLVSGIEVGQSFPLRSEPWIVTIFEI